MASDLAAIGPSAIVAVAFLVGVWMVLRRELGPKRRARSEGDAFGDEAGSGEHDERTES
jgi:hypothetical protein